MSMDMEDVDRILRQVAEQEPENFRLWVEENYCVTCPHYNDEQETVVIL
jgi:hypothetical protein